jgi:hypothetical protein
MMWRIFESAIVRKIAYVLVALAASFLFGHRSHATTTTVSFMFPAFNTPNGGPISQAATGQQWCQAYLVGLNTAQGTSATLTTVNIPGAPTSAGQALSCVVSSGLNQTGIVSVGGFTCNSTDPPQDLLGTIAGSGSYTSGGGMCYNGCEYTNGNLVVTFGASNSRFAGKAVSTGQACGTGGALSSDAPTLAGSCVTAAGKTACADSTGVRGTYSNGAGTVPDAIVPGTPGTGCVTYASGAMSCSSSVTTAPPAPSTSTVSTNIATATESVTNTSTSTTTNYYSSTVVAASKGNIPATGSGGLPAGSTAGTSTGTSITPNGPNGDCGATGVNCTSDGTLPSLTRSDTIQSNVQTYWNAVAAAPIVAAFSSISGSWPTASCPTETFTIAMFHGSSSMDAMAPICSIWGGTVAPTLSLVFLALWAVQGIRIIMSA